MGGFRQNLVDRFGVWHRQIDYILMDSDMDPETRIFEVIYHNWEIGPKTIKKKKKFKKKNIYIYKK